MANRPTITIPDTQDYLLSEFLNRYKFHKILYNEKYSSTSLVLDIKTGNYVVLKENLIKSHLQNILNEINILKRIKHNGIIKMLDYHITEGVKAYIILEYYEKGDLFNFQLRCPQYFIEGNVIEIIRQLLEIISYCHLNNICHRDIKLENILMNNDNNLVLIDFGLSKLKKGDKFIMNDLCGSLDYIAPEIIISNGNLYDEKCDSWNIGIVLYILLFKSYPFSGKTKKLTINNITSNDFSMPYNPSDDVIDLLFKLLCKDPSTRISIDDALQHPCFSYAL